MAKRTMTSWLASLNAAQDHVLRKLNQLLVILVSKVKL